MSVHVHTAVCVDVFRFYGVSNAGYYITEKFNGNGTKETEMHCLAERGMIMTQYFRNVCQEYGEFNPKVIE